MQGPPRSQTTPVTAVSVTNEVLAPLAAPRSQKLKQPAEGLSHPRAPLGHPTNSTGEEPAKEIVPDMNRNILCRSRDNEHHKAIFALPKTSLRSFKPIKSSMASSDLIKEKSFLSRLSAYSHPTVYAC